MKTFEVELTWHDGRVTVERVKDYEIEDLEKHAFACGIKFKVLCEVSRTTGLIHRMLEFGPRFKGLTILEWATSIFLTILGLLVVVFTLRFLGEIFRAYLPPHILLWAVIPVVACLLNTKSAFVSLTLIGFQRMQVFLMVLVCWLSFAIFANYYVVRNTVGERFVEGYTSWTTVSENNVDGLYYGQDWSAKHATGRWGLRCFELGVFCALFAFPWITWEASSNAVQAKEQMDFSEERRRSEKPETPTPS